MPYQSDRKWSDQFLPEVKSIIGPLLLEPAAFEQDAMEATDLIILHARDMRIGVRIRRNQYLNKYSSQITFRFKRDSGAQTEWEKILRGWGEWFFYGFAGVGDLPPLSRWYLVNLNALRYQYGQQKPFLTSGLKDNDDGTYFKWFDVRSFADDPKVLIASSAERVAA